LQGIINIGTMYYIIYNYTCTLYEYVIHVCITYILQMCYKIILIVQRYTYKVSIQILISMIATNYWYYIHTIPVICKLYWKQGRPQGRARQGRGPPKFHLALPVALPTFWENRPWVMGYGHKYIYAALPRIYLALPWPCRKQTAGVATVHMAFPLWTATLILCLRWDVDRWSPVATLRRRPTSDINLIASGPHGPRVSRAIGVNM